MEFYTLHLFAGAGGGILADEIMGFRTVGAVELEEYPRRVLLTRQADGSLPRFPVWDDVTTFRIDNPGTRNYIERLRTVRDRLCISGGFPCQDISSAGKREGITGEHSGLWKEFARIIGEIRPRFAFLENSPVLIRRGIDVVAGDVSEMGYSVTWGIISASDVGAKHERRRFWGLAIRNDADAIMQRFDVDADKIKSKQNSFESNGILQHIPDAKSARFETMRHNGNIKLEQSGFNELLQRIGDNIRKRIERVKKNQTVQIFDGRNEREDIAEETIQVEPRLGGMVDGLEDWLDEVTTGRFWDVTEHGLPRLLEQCENRRKRLKAIGNGQVPLCAAVAFVTLLDRYIQFTQ